MQRALHGLALLPWYMLLLYMLCSSTASRAHHDHAYDAQGARDEEDTEGEEQGGVWVVHDDPLHLLQRMGM